MNFCLVTSCLDLLEEGNRRSGTYQLTFGDEKKDAFCDMSTLGGGWTVISRQCFTSLTPRVHPGDGLRS